MEKMLLVDGNSILNRAFYGLPDLTTSDGRHTNAVLGFLNILLKVCDEETATHLCVAFDVKHPTFRHERFEAYKGTRKPMPEELREQLPLIKEVLHAMNIFTIEKAGYEADDILGTLSRKCLNENMPVTVLSGDRDLLQLATDFVKIKLPKTKAGKTIMEEYYAQNVEETYGVDPITFIDMKGLMGDTSDNIPGVPGIGEKSAAKLLAEYGSMEGVYASIDSMKQSKMKENLITYKEQAFLSKELATIKLDCVLDAEFEQMKIENMFNDASYTLFSELEFKSLLSRFDDACGKQTIDFKTEIIDEYDRYSDVLSMLSKEKMVAFHIGLNNQEPICVSFTSDGELVYIVKLVNFITDDMIFAALKELATKTKLVCLDLKAYLRYIDFSDTANVFDIGLAAYLINPLKSQYSYDELATDYLKTTLPDEKTVLKKTELTIFSVEEEPWKTFLAYNTIVAFLCHDILLKKLQNMDMESLYQDIEIPCLYALYDMEKNGILVDRQALSSYGERLKKRIDELVLQIYADAGKEFNINSTKQLGELLFEELGLKSGKKTKTGYSTSVEVLEKIRNEHPIVEKILEYRQLTKLNSTYVEGLMPYISEDNRIHGTFNQTVTATGRISSTEPNLQNIPTRYPLGREIRKVFVPEEGFVFLDADYSQIELRVLAHFSEDETLIRAYHENTDIHSITASEVFDVPIEEVDSLMRRKAKAVNFGIVYGISSFGLGQDLDISRKEAEGYIAKYFETYQGVKHFLDESVAFAKEKGYSKTLFGRRRPLPELASSNFMTRSFGERVAMNAPIQGTAADIIKIAMIRVNQALKQGGFRSRLVLQIHDELLIEVAKDELEQVSKLLKEHMTHAVSLSVPMLIDMHTGDCWYDAK